MPVPPEGYEYTEVWNQFTAAGLGGFADAVEWTGTLVRALVMDRELDVTIDVDVPATITSLFTRGGSLNIDSGVTVTFYGPVEAGLYQIFSGDGTVRFAVTTTVYPEWWGAVGDESADDQPALQAASDSIGPYFATYAEYGASVHEKGEVLLTNRYRVDSTWKLYEGISVRGLNPPSHGGTYYVPALRPRRAGTQIVSNIQDGSNIIEVIGSAAEPEPEVEGQPTGTVVFYDGYIGGFTIWGTGATGIPGSDGHGLAFLAERFAYSDVEDLLIRGVGENGFHVDPTCAYYYNTVRKVRSVRSGNHNWHLDGNGIYQTHNYFQHCRSSGGVETHGWYLDTWCHCTFIDCIGEGAVEKNWYLKACFQNGFYGCGGECGDYLREIALDLEGSNRNNFNGCYHIRGGAITFADSSDNTFVGCRVSYIAAGITGASQAETCVVTAIGSYVRDGQEIYIQDVVGMTQLNENVYTAANPSEDGSTFELLGIDSRAYGAYVSGGHAVQAYTLVFDSDSDNNTFLVLHEGGSDLDYSELKDEGSWNRIIGRNHNWDTVQTQDYKPINAEYKPELIRNAGFEADGAGGDDVFLGWVEKKSDGTLAKETSVVYNGGAAAKLTAGATKDTRLEGTFVPIPGRHYWFAFFTQGDGTNAGQYSVYDRTNGGWLVPHNTSTGVIAATWTLVTAYFTAPAGCILADVRLVCPDLDTAYAYFDDVTVREV